MVRENSLREVLSFLGPSFRSLLLLPSELLCRNVNLLLCERFLLDDFDSDDVCIMNALCCVDDDTPSANTIIAASAMNRRFEIMLCIDGLLMLY